MGDEQPLKARSKHQPDYRCALCHERVAVEVQAPCLGCGTILHGDCRVAHGGCPTLGCSEASRGAERGRAAPPDEARPHVSLPGVLAWGSLGAGAAGMGISLLPLASGSISGVLAGGAGFVGGSVLVAAGLVAATALAARKARPARAHPLVGVPTRHLAAVLARLTLAAGLLGMLASFLVIGLGVAPGPTAGPVLLCGMAGFLAGAVLVGGGVASVGLEALARGEDGDDEA